MKPKQALDKIFYFADIGTLNRQDQRVINKCHKIIAIELNKFNRLKKLNRLALSIKPFAENGSQEAMGSMSQVLDEIESICEESEGEE